MKGRVCVVFVYVYVCVCACVRVCVCACVCECACLIVLQKEKLKDLRRKMKGKSKKNGEIINKMEERKRKMAENKKGECNACVRERVMIYGKQQTLHAHKQIAN